MKISVTECGASADDVGVFCTAKRMSEKQLPQKYSFFSICALEIEERVAVFFLLQIIKFCARVARWCTMQNRNFGSLCNLSTPGTLCNWVHSVTLGIKQPWGTCAALETIVIASVLLMTVMGNKDVDDGLAFLPGGSSCHGWK